MKCIQIHNDYLVPGGETTSAKLIAKELENNGVEVIRYYKNNREISNKKNIFSKIKYGLKSVYNLSTIVEVEEILKKNDIDFAIVHNTSPLISNSIYYILSKYNIPILKYVQNYNLLCMNGSKNLNANICNKCIKSSSMIGVKNKCYKESYIYTILKLINKKVFEKYFKNNITKYVAISHFVKEEHLKYGLNKDKFEVLYHFINNISSDTSFNPKVKYFLYMGRLSEEKGVNILLETFKDHQDKKLFIIGEGPMKDEVEGFIAKNNCSNIEYLGFKNGIEKENLVKNALCLVIPSDWDEPFGRIVIESYGLGTPVIASDRGGLGELVDEGITGYKFNSKNKAGFSSKITKIWNVNSEDYLKMRSNCIRKSNKEFSREVYIGKLKNLIDTCKEGKEYL
ncbi:glycosyltransferase family 4 protein [Bacillus sp. UNCCL81]|uniref:glycosyltransferase family 4 protein n=1 Tax=Bacillus sp. UNCCL81 TaxID=1502755 RepID=UPI0008F2A1F0|nr:glycosyltransferase family 4 protein [Bacillus sp. UNCCL81]SFD09964.1 Glycosyltransferase involved in cell wall bisynthesis [Bacillus sp. UNCCL81]